MRPSSAMATIDTVVAYVLSDMNMESEYPTRGERVAQMILRGYAEFNLYHIDNIRVAYLTVDENNSVELPYDYIDYIKIATQINGRLWTLTANDNIPLPAVDKCGDQIQSVTSAYVGVGGYYFPDHYNNGRFIGAAYSLTGGFNYAYYRIDLETRRIFFSGFVPNGQIVLEYVSTGIALSSKTIIPRIAVEPLVNYVLYKIALRDPRMNRGTIADYKSEYQDSVRLMRFQIGSMTESEFRDIHYASYKMTPKR